MPNDTGHTRNSTDERFYIDDHALLYAYTAQSADELAGEQGLEATIKAIVAYSRERGLRAAARCVLDGEPLSGKNYILYGEWFDPRAWAKSKITATTPYYKTTTTLCPWCDIWKESGLLKYGKLYCDWVDMNLLRGFNPDLRLEMPGIISHGAAGCEFEWLDCVFESEEEAASMESRRAELIPRVTKDFLYHCGHLLSAFRRELYLELGLLKGKAIIEAAVAKYEDRFGSDKAQEVVKESFQDFLKV